MSKISLPLVPGGAEAFELAAKYCYGIKIEITLSNVAMLRCAAYFLEMTDQYADKSLETKSEQYLSDTILQSIANSISVLHKCETLLPIAELITAIVNNACKEQLSSGLLKLKHDYLEPKHL